MAMVTKRLKVSSRAALRPLDHGVPLRVMPCLSTVGGLGDDAVGSGVAARDEDLGSIRVHGREGGHGNSLVRRVQGRLASGLHDALGGVGRHGRRSVLLGERGVGLGEVHGRKRLLHGHGAADELPLLGLLAEAEVPGDEQQQQQAEEAANHAADNRAGGVIRATTAANALADGDDVPQASSQGLAGCLLCSK